MVEKAPAPCTMKMNYEIKALARALPRAPRCFPVRHFQCRLVNGWPVVMSTDRSTSTFEFNCA